MKAESRSKPIVGTTNRSMAAMSGAWLRKKVRHPWLGGPRRLTMYLATLDCATSNPSLPHAQFESVRKGNPLSETLQVRCDRPLGSPLMGSDASLRYRDLSLQ